MKMRFAAVLFVSLVAACVGAPPDSSGGGGGGGGGTGGGGGGGGGSGEGSGSGSGTGTGTGGSITATQFLAQMSQKFCDEAFTCKTSFPTDAGVTFADAFGASSQECVSSATAYDMPSVVEQQITAGKIKFNGADAATCVSGLTFPACTEFWQNGPNAPAACDTAMQGTVADGAACLVDYECSNAQSYCDQTTKKCTVDTQQGARRMPGFDATDVSISSYSGTANN
jgi:hypothetical protein